jgi:hypothetical protein
MIIPITIEETIIEAIGFFIPRVIFWKVFKAFAFIEILSLFLPFYSNKNEKIYKYA